MSLGRLGHYEILDRIGQGGMGVVFRARDTRLGRVLALKIIADEFASDPEYRARLLREARAEAALDHPSIATCFDVGEAPLDPPDMPHPGHRVPDPERVPYLAMEFVPGEDLATQIQRRPLGIDRVIEIAIQVLSALEAAHRHGVVHRDLKPANVRITPEGRAKILDFGLARMRIAQGSSTASTVVPSSFQTSEGRAVGTLAYMAPEQAEGSAVDARSDLFSFGVMLYQMITGRLPFEGATTVELFYSMANREPPPLARFAHGVPDEIERIVRKLLSREPSRRYQSAHEVLTDLERVRESRAGARRVVRHRSRLLAVLGLLLLVAGAIAGGWRYRDWFKPPPRSIAVLPFENATGDSTLDYVSSGLANELRNDLVDRTGLDVVSRGSIESAPAIARRAADLARRFGAGSLLSGTLRRDPEGLRLEVELVNAPSGFVRWSSSYPFTTLDALRIKRDILEQVASRLSVRLDGGTAGGRAAPYPTRSVSAYDAYLQGERLLDDLDDPQAPDRASDQFNRALVLDPEFALAWAERSRALFRIYSRDHRPETLRSAAQAADRALELRPDLPEGQIARAQIYRGTSRTNEAITLIQQVIRGRPTWDEAYVQLAATYRNAGRLDLAEQNYRRALELAPDKWRNWNSLGALLTKSGDYAGARKAFEQVAKLAPEKNVGYQQLGAVAMLQNDYEEAVAQYRRLPSPVQDPLQASNMGTACFYTGRLKEAIECFSLAARLQPTNPNYARNLGDCYVRAGKPDQARAQYQEAVRLVDAQLRVEPGNVDLRFDRALMLAKAGDCERARAALHALGPTLSAGAAEYAYSSAMAHALCGARREALSALGAAIRRGVPAGRARGEDEFRALRGDPEFDRLTAAARADSAHPSRNGTR